MIKTSSKHAAWQNTSDKLSKKESGLFVVTDLEYTIDFITESYRSIELATLLQIEVFENNILSKLVEVRLIALICFTKSYSYKRT